MKNLSSMLQVVCLLTFFSPFQSVKAQCINKFPYTEDFEKFQRIQEVEACNTAILGDTANGWLQDLTDGGDWRADTSGTPSVGTGPGATDTSNGVGVGKDYNPGTTGGRYLYTEATSATGCANKVVSLISPCFDLSGTAYYRVKLAYHMFGAGMGSLHIDVYDSIVWVTDVWKISGDQGLNWVVAEISLANFRKSQTRIRIRAVMGSNFLSDCAIDDFKIESFTPPLIDLLLTEIRNLNGGYHMIPYKQADSIRLWAKAKNEGIQTAQNCRIVAGNGSISDSLKLGTMSSFEQDSGYIPTPFLIKKGMSNTILFRVSSAGSDADPSNDTMTVQTYYNDSTYSRDDGTFTGGLGFNGATGGQVGQMYELLHDDTLTSVTFFIANPVAGDSVKVQLYEYGTAPGNLIASTRHVQLMNGVNWYTLRFPCEQFLKKGKYFIAVQQLNLNNMSLGYSGKYYVQNTAYYNGGAGWVELGSANFRVVMLVRMNLGKLRFPDVQIESPDSSCSGQPITLQAKGAKSYVWLSGGVIRDSTKTTVQVTPQQTFSITLRGTNVCGLSSSVSKLQLVNRTPAGTVSPDTVACVGDYIMLRASGGSSYTWVGGPSNQNWRYLVSGSELVSVEIDSNNGCKRRMSVNITGSKATVQAMRDTTVCRASLLRLSAQSAASYQWVDGPATANWNVRPDKQTKYVVYGYNSLGCKAIDTVVVQVQDGPAVLISNDTALCFGERITLHMSGGDAWQWKGGPASKSWNLLPLSSGYYYGTASFQGGCSTTDSVYIQVARTPVMSLRQDTTLCEGGSVRLHAATTDATQFIWSTGETSQSILVSPVTGTSYRVEASNEVGCASVDSVFIGVNPLPKAAFSYSVKARDITLTNLSQHAESHSWDFGDGSGSSDRNTFHRYTQDGTYSVKLTVTNACGSRDTTEEIEIINLGVQDPKQGMIQIYPNPAAQRFHVKWDDPHLQLKKMELRDMQGRLVLHVPVLLQDSQVVVDTIALSKGMYKVLLYSNHGIFNSTLLLTE